MVPSVNLINASLQRRYSENSRLRNQTDIKVSWTHSMYRSSKLNMHQKYEQLTVFKGDVRPKTKISYLIVLGVPARMVKARGECDKLFRIYLYKQLNNCAAPTLGK